MKNSLKAFMLLILFTYGCTPPLISVVNLTDQKIYDNSIMIDGDYYAILQVYDIYQFNKRLNDSLISFVELNLSEGKILECDSITLTKDSIYCFSENGIVRYNISKVDEINLYRKRDNKDIENGISQIVLGPSLGFLTDLANENENGYLGTIIGGSLGIVIGAFYIFDNHRDYERIYIKK